jgi:hypothetical protein
LFPDEKLDMIFALEKFGCHQQEIGEDAMTGICFFAT